MIFSILIVILTICIIGMIVIPPYDNFQYQQENYLDIDEEMASKVPKFEKGDRIKVRSNDLDPFSKVVLEVYIIDVQKNSKGYWYYLLSDIKTPNCSKSYIAYKIDSKKFEK